MIHQVQDYMIQIKIKTIIYNIHSEMNLKWMQAKE